MRVLFSTAILATMFVCAGAPQSHASDWWNKAKEILNSDTGNTISKTIQSPYNGATGLSNSDVSAGLREALRIGTQKVVGKIGVKDGFNLDPTIHIPLPGALGKVDSALSKIGMGSLTDDLELRINRAAEAATPKAKALFITAISEMTIEDAKQILTGPNDAASTYLRKTMGPGLSEEMQPIVQNALASAGAIQAYDGVMGQYQKLPFMPDVKSDLNDYVVEQAMNGIFYYVAQEEAAIRENPAARTTDLLKKVFAAR